MRVCDIVTNSIWYDPRVKRQIREYAKRDNIELFCVGIKNQRYNEDEVKRLPGTVIFISVDPKYYGPTRTPLTKIVREIKIISMFKDAIVNAKPDIIHANDLDGFAPAYLAAKKLGCKVIYDTHEIFLENNNIKQSGLKRLFWGVWEKRIIKKADLVICVSHAAADYLAKKYSIPHPTVITNCAMLDDAEKAQLQKSEAFDILNHGQFYGGRGYDTMVKAAKLLADTPVRLLLRGFGPMEEELKNEIKKNNLTNIEMLPPVKVEELIPAASSASVGVAITEPTCLNFKLSVSNKIFEYAAAGLPVIMSNIIEHQYLNGKYNFGIVMHDDSPESLAAAIREMYNNKTLYNTFKTNAKKLTSELNWESEFEQLIKLEEKLFS